MEHIGKQIGKYTITKFIGEGGMASVYEGEHEALGTKAAIKILNPILSANKQIRERFKNEARIMASLDHPNIIRVYDYEESDTYLAIAMELLKGEDLSERIKRMGSLSEEELKHIFNQVLSAFEYAHSLGIVHRDIKPSNIFVLSNGTVKILDFGIAKLFGQGNEMTQTGTQMGTPVYMSPEQVKADKSIDHRSDIYSLGVTMFYALSGKSPYDVNTNSQFDIFTKIVHEPFPELESTSYLADLVRKACQKDRELRFQSCEEWLQQLKKGAALKTESLEGEKTVLSELISDITVVEMPDSDRTLVEINSLDRTMIKSDLEDDSKKSTTEKLSETLLRNNCIDQNGNKFDTVRIGNQTWGTENLNVDKFRNGDSIPEARTSDEWKIANENKKPAWCYYDNDPKNSEKYGKLYNWYAVNDPRGLSPNGYHMPSDNDWIKLEEYLGIVTSKKMKNTSEWYSNGNGINSSGFQGLPGGCRNGGGNFNNKGNYGFWWSSSEYITSSSDYRYLDFYNDSLYADYSKADGFSVRCLRD